MSGFCLSLTYLECPQADTPNEWKNKKNTYSIYFVFTPSDIDLKEHWFWKTKLEKGIYQYNESQGLFSEKYPNPPNLKSIPIKRNNRKEVSLCSKEQMCRDGNGAYIDRESLELYKWHATRTDAFFTPDNVWRSKNFYKVAGSCKIIEEDEFFENVGELLNSATNKNQI